VSREEIMALPKLQGFWKYQDMVVRFRFEARNWPARAERFIPRQVIQAEDRVRSAPAPENPAPEEENAAVHSLPHIGHANAQPEAAIAPKRQWRFIRVEEKDEMAMAPAQIDRADGEKRQSAVAGGNLEV